MSKNRFRKKLKLILDIAMITVALLSTVILLSQVKVKWQGYIPLEVQNIFTLNHWCSIVFGTGAYLLHLVYKWWLTGREKYNEDMARAEIVKHWILICALVFFSLFFLLK